VSRIRQTLPLLGGPARRPLATYEIRRRSSSRSTSEPLWRELASCDPIARAGLSLGSSRSLRLRATTRMNRVFLNVGPPPPCPVLDLVRRKIICACEIVSTSWLRPPSPPLTLHNYELPERSTSFYLYDLFFIWPCNLIPTPQVGTLPKLPSLEPRRPQSLSRPKECRGFV